MRAGVAARCCWPCSAWAGGGVRASAAAQLGLVGLLIVVVVVAVAGSAAGGPGSQLDAVRAAWLARGGRGRPPP